ncbi:MAG: hypothetical protein RBT41_01855 [Clostridia bacterium]|jgi:hypothetical protein|nr:hypothetical protein [Clostridia bacterium]
MFFDKRVFLIKKIKKGNILKSTWNYQIFDPETDEQIGELRDGATGMAKILGKVFQKRFLTRYLDIYDVRDNSLVFSTKITPLSSKVTVLDNEGKLVGRLDSKFLSGCFYFVYDASDREVGQVKGHIMSKDFALVGPHEEGIGVITRSWDGVGGALLAKSPFCFIVAVEDPLAHTPQVISMLLLATGLALDIGLTKR